MARAFPVRQMAPRGAGFRPRPRFALRGLGDQNFIGPPAVNYPDGSLIKTATDDHVYLIQNNVRRWIPDATTFLCMGFQWSQIVVAADSDVNDIMLGDPMPKLTGTACTAVTVQGPPQNPIPPNGPLPPGAGYQQYEAPGYPYPYIYIGGGTPPGSPLPVQPNYVPQYPPGMTNLPMPNGGIVNPQIVGYGSSSGLSSPGIGSQISNFFSQYGGYIALGGGALLLFSMFNRGGSRR